MSRLNERAAPLRVAMRCALAALLATVAGAAGAQDAPATEGAGAPAATGTAPDGGAGTSSLTGTVSGGGTGAAAGTTPTAPATVVAPETLAPLNAAVAGCAAVPSLRAEQPLDLGDVRIQRDRDGYLSVSPRGEVINAVSVMVRREPMPAMLSLCGAAEQDVAILIQQPSLRLSMPGANPVAREVRDIRVEGQGIALQKVEDGRWEGRLGPTGRATILVGATVYFSATGKHGTAGADIEIDVVAR